MDLLKRAIASRFTGALAIAAGTFTAWFPSGSVEVAITCVGSTATKDDTQMPMGGFLHRPKEEVTIHVKLTDLPGGIAPAIASRFFAGTSATRNAAISYQVDSVKNMSHLANWIEVKGTRS
jgi:hypothetical protein